eukprot:GSA120T00021600001.1
MVRSIVLRFYSRRFICTCSWIWSLCSPCTFDSLLRGDVAVVSVEAGSRGKCFVSGLVLPNSQRTSTTSKKSNSVVSLLQESREQVHRRDRENSGKESRKSEPPRTLSVTQPRQRGRTKLYPSYYERSGGPDVFTSSVSSPRSLALPSLLHRKTLADSELVTDTKRSSWSSFALTKDTDTASEEQQSDPEECLRKHGQWKPAVRVNLLNPSSFDEQRGVAHDGGYFRARTCTVGGYRRFGDAYIGGFCHDDSDADHCREFCQESVLASDQWRFLSRQRCCYCESSELSAPSSGLRPDETGGLCSFNGGEGLRAPLSEDNFLPACCDGWRLERLLDDPFFDASTDASSTTSEGQNQGTGDEVREERHQCQLMFDTWKSETVQQKALVRWRPCHDPSGADDQALCPREARVKSETLLARFPNPSACCAVTLLKHRPDSVALNSDIAFEIPAAYLPLETVTVRLKGKESLGNRLRIDPSINVWGSRNLTVADMLGKSLAAGTDGADCWYACHMYNGRQAGCATDFCVRRQFGLLPQSAAAIWQSAARRPAVPLCYKCEGPPSRGAIRGGFS